MRSSPYALLGVAACLALAAVPASARQGAPPELRAGTYAFDPAHSKITWKVVHEGFSTYVGQFAKVEGVLQLDPATPANSKLNVTVDTGSVGTLNPALDQVLKSATFLNVAKFPAATFNATKIEPTGPTTGRITGDLTLHGVTRPVTLEATLNKAAVNDLDKRYSLGFAGEAAIKRSDFGITSFVPAVSDEVRLEIAAELKLTK